MSLTTVDEARMARTRNQLSDYLSFKRMIVPEIIQGIFWLLFFLLVVGSLQQMAQINFLGGLLTLVVGSLFVRIFCELLVILFRIHDSLAMTEKKSSK